MAKRIYLFTLQTFSATGGIQKMTRTLAHSLQQIAVVNRWNFSLWSLCDKPENLMSKYMRPENFRGFARKRWDFLVSALRISKKADVIILSHINLAVIGVIAKIIHPDCKVWLIAHGIEVWRPLSPMKKALLGKCDKIICVSQFTRQEIISRHGVKAYRCEVLNNVIDPFMVLPQVFEKPEHLVQRYQLNAEDTILFSLTRLAATEQYKGYDQIIAILPKIRAAIPNIKYVLSGKYDDFEAGRLRQLISFHQVEKQVILTGFVDEQELTDHFLLADLFALPSKKEGFGIVFIEALACGLPVVCGNVDGSLDAIKNGALGRAVNPDDLIELERTIIEELQNPVTMAGRRNFQQRCVLYFNENDYIMKLRKLLN